MVVDFTSAPTRRKPITVAHGALTGVRLALQRVEELGSFDAFEALGWIVSAPAARAGRAPELAPSA